MGPQLERCGDVMPALVQVKVTTPAGTGPLTESQDHSVCMPLDPGADPGFGPPNCDFGPVSEGTLGVGLGQVLGAGWGSRQPGPDMCFWVVDCGLGHSNAS